MVLALGERVGGVLGSEDVVDDVLAAGKTAGEAQWPMPIPESMTERIHSSKIADLAQHDWVRWGGGLFAGAFLREFTDGLPWAHLDIAGPAFNTGSAYGHVTAGGTGFAPIKGVIEHALHRGIDATRPMVLYWGARAKRDLYLPDLPGTWQQQSRNFTYIPVLSEPLPEDDWHGRSGFVHQAVLDDFGDLSGYQVYACGGPAMIDVARKTFAATRASRWSRPNASTRTLVPSASATSITDARETCSSAGVMLVTL